MMSRDIISLTETPWASKAFRAKITPAFRAALARGAKGILFWRCAMRVNTCDNCGRDFWTGDDHETICCTCAFELARAPRVEYVVKEVPPPVANKVKRLLKIKQAEIKKVETKTQISRKEQAAIYERNKLAGYVYLMRSGNGYYKIGISKNVKSRAWELNRQFPIQIEVVHQFACNDYRKVEKFLHDKYSTQRAQYEWFVLETADVQWIMSVKDYELG